MIMIESRLHLTALAYAVAGVTVAVRLAMAVIADEAGGES